MNQAAELAAFKKHPPSSAASNMIYAPVWQM